MGLGIHRKRPAPSQPPAALHKDCQDPPAKRRATQACLSCRNRKVRCDVVRSGMPCTNCRLDDVECEVRETQRGRKPSSASRSAAGVSAAIKESVGRTASQRHSDVHDTDGGSRQNFLDDTCEVVPRMGEEGAERDEDHEGSVILCLPGESPHTMQETRVSEQEQEQQQPEQYREPQVDTMMWAATTETQEQFSSSPPMRQPSQLREQRGPATEHGLQDTSRASSRMHSLPLSPQSASSGVSRALCNQPSQPRKALHDPPAALPFRRHEQPGDGIHLPHAEHAQRLGRPKLPRYIKSVPRHLDKKDLEYLEARGCLSIPDDELRNEILCAYISVVYPLIPAIDLEEFIGAIMEDDGHNPISLLLFQSIMFVAVAFVDSKLLFARGYSSHKAARTDFFNRARTLYSLNYERDRVALTQSLLAFTYWYDAPDDDRDTWYWMGIALTTAQVAGFHRDPTAAAASHRVRDARLQRRIWWCCFMRDRLLALGLRRPPRIRDDEYNVTMLIEDDFDLSPPSATLIALFKTSRFPSPNSDSRRDAATMSIELSRLSLTMGRLLYTQYTVVGAYSGGSEYLLDGPNQPRRTDSQVAMLAQCSVELSDWVQRQDSYLPYAPGVEPSPTGESEGSSHGGVRDNMTRFHRIQLHMLYLTTLAALRRPSVFCQPADPNRAPDGGAVSRPTETVIDPAVELVKLGHDLQRSDQLRYLTTTAVPSFLSACLVHLINSRQKDEESRNLSLGRLYQSIYVLQQLQSIYSSADYAICFLKTILANTQLRVPLLSMEDAATYRTCDSRTAKSSIDMGPREVAAACMYPSPSISANCHKPAGDEPSSLSPPTTGMEAWLSPWQGDMAAADMPPFHELVAGSPFISSWCEFDSMIPTLISVEGNSTSFAGGVPVPYLET